MDLLPPGNVPAPAVGDNRADFPDFWASDFWPALWPKLMLSYADATARDAELAGLGPSDRAFAFVEDSKTMWRWTGSAWALAAPWIQSGTVSLGGDATNPRSQAVTFAYPFTGTPIVDVLCVTSTTTSSVTWGVWPSSISSTGVTVNGIRNNTTTMTVRWVATLLP